jgi:hypothetical protein
MTKAYHALDPSLVRPIQSERNDQSKDVQKPTIPSISNGNEPTIPISKNPRKAFEKTRRIQRKRNLDARNGSLVCQIWLEGIMRV